jgi:hypothetical protein
LEHPNWPFLEQKTMSAYDTATQEGTDAELTDFDGRPDDCSCTGSRLEAEGGLPCWPCYRDGFDVPNPSAGEE